MLAIPASGALRTWSPTTTSAITASNYTGSGSLLLTDSLVITGSTNWIIHIGDSLNVKCVTVLSTFSGLYLDSGSLVTQTRNYVNGTGAVVFYGLFQMASSGLFYIGPSRR
jgi:hypothetical protein